MDKIEKIDKSLEGYASRAGFDYVDGIVQEEPGHRWNDHDVEFAYRDGIIAGAEWGAEHLRDSTKMIDKSLEEAAEEYTQQMIDKLNQM